MSDVLSTSVSGLLAFQRALTVTSNNISNVATPGYSVQNPSFTPNPGQATASGYIGSGVSIDTITRSYDELLAGQVRTSQSGYSSFNTYASTAAQVTNMLSNTTTGLTASLQAFVNAVQTVANSPSSTAQRQALLSQAQGLTQQLQSYNSQLASYSQGVESQLGSTVTQINTLSAGIAQLNGQIAQGLASTGQPPNDLMDKRDLMLDQLSQYVSVSTATQADGSMNVYIGTGQPLVVGSTSQALSAFTDPYDSTKHDIGIVSGGSTADVTSEITGGSLGGLLAVRSQVLQPVQNTLGQFSIGLATLVNGSQQAGMDLTGAAGKPMFSVGPVQVNPASTNTGAATVSVTRTNVSNLTPDDYILRQSGGTWQLTDKMTGKVVPMTGAGTSASPFTADGISIVVGGGAPVNGDSFLIQPTAAATTGLSVLLTSPAQIAVASGIQTSPTAGNAGTAAVSSSVVSNPSVWVPGAYKISFTTATQYQVTDSTNAVVGSGTYSTGTPITFNGISVTMTGNPTVGDSFNVGAASSSNVGDNSNAFALVNSLNALKFNGGTTSLSNVANNLVSQTGVLTQQAQANASAQKAVNSSATTTRNNLSGVSLDEEAAKMVQYQQAYSACAQLIQTANTMFNSLISAVHG